MPLFTPAERPVADAISELVYCNPFAPERIGFEKRALGERFDPADTVWNASHDRPVDRRNVIDVATLAETLCAAARQRLANGTRPRTEEASIYEGLVMHALYYRTHNALDRALSDALHLPATVAPAASTPTLSSAFASMVADLQFFLGEFDLPGVDAPDAAHLIACFWQVRRAFDQIFRSIVGTSVAAARLRAMAWESVFTHDMRRYRRYLYDKTGDFPTLVVGPSGTGKELVARAIGASRYIPFDARRKAFTEDFAGSFFALNLSALSPTLVESELFGHRRGAFTGAVEDRAGWLQTCPSLGTVFLDEIGELDSAIQVKLLRVLQSREFQRLGDTKTLEFHGKIIAATNRDLAEQMRRGAFRRDLYYRLCADVITTPSLRQQIEGGREELRALVRYIAGRLLPDDADALTGEVVKVIDRRLGPDYPWPGNVRELEQCVRNVLVRGDYAPLATPVNTGGADDLSSAVAAGSLSADELLTRYVAHVHNQSGTYEATARRLKLDRRTVAVRVAAARKGYPVES